MASEFHLSGGVWKWVADSDDVGTEPDLTSLAGVEVEFVCNIPGNKPLPVAGGVMFVTRRTATIGEDGSLVDEQGNAGIDLLGDDPSFDLSVPVQWQVRIGSFEHGGKNVRPVPYWVDAPLPGVSASIDELTPVPGVSLPGGTKGDRGFRTRAVPVDAEDPATLYQWVDENGAAVGAPVALSEIVNVGSGSIADASASGLAVLTGDAAAGRDAIGIGNRELWWSAKQYGVPQAGRRKRGGAIASGQAILTLSDSAFTAGDLVVVRGAGTSGSPLVTTVTTGGTGSCTLAATASTTVSNAVVDWGPDESSAITAFFAAIVAAGQIDYQISTLAGTVMHPVYPTAFFPDGGISMVGSTIVKPQGVGLIFGANAWIRAGASISGAVLATSVTSLIQHETWHNIGIDANQVADNNLDLPYFAGLMIPNARLGGSKKVGIIAGDSGAVTSSYQLMMPNLNMRREKGDTVPVGSYGLHTTQHCTDSKFDGVVAGYDVNVYNAGANNDHDIHAWNYRDNVSTVIFYDTATTARYHVGCTADSPRGVTHPSASAGTGVSTIADSAVLAFHAGLPVSGTNIPANSYVGTVTPGVSFTLVNAPSGGSAVNTTGAVSGVTISGAGWVVAGTGTVIRGYALNTIEDNTNLVGVVIAAAATPSGDIDLDVRGTTGCVWNNDVLGDTRGIVRLFTRCSNVTATTQSQFVQDTGKVALLLRNSASGGVDAFRLVNSGNNAVLASLETSGVWKGFNFTAQKGTPAYGTTVAMDYRTGRWQTITVTNTTAFTISNPTQGPASAQTGELTIEILNSSGAAMGTITWGALFLFAGLTWTNPASTKKRYAKFEWNGTNWVCTAISADY